MKNKLPLIIGVIIVLGAVGAYLITKNNDKDTNTSNNSSTTTSDNKTADPLAFKFKDACKLFTKEQISEVFGGTFGEGEEDIAFNAATPGIDNYEAYQGSACKFDQEDDGTTASMADSIRLSTEIKNFESVDKATTWMNDLHSPPTAEGQEAIEGSVDVDGVGDQAFFSIVNTGDTGMSDKNEAINIRFGNQVIVLTVTKLSGVDHEATRTNLTTLAKKLD